MSAHYDVNEGLFHLFQIIIIIISAISWMALKIASCYVIQQTEFHTRMWANAQRDGRPAEYTWHRVLNAAILARPHCSSAVQ